MKKLVVRGVRMFSGSSIKSHALLVAPLAVAGALSFASAANATVRKEGTWPDGEKPVSIDVSGVSRQDAVKELADEAGWSLVMPGSLSTPGSAGDDEHVDIHVKNQPASKVLDLILSDGSFVAKRDGTLIAILRDGAAGNDAKSGDAKHTASGNLPLVPPIPPIPPIPAIPPVPPVPPVAPLPPVSITTDAGHKHGHNGDDRVVTGGHVTIERDEAVGSLTVFGGSVDIFGQVDGDLAVVGGNVHIHEGGHVNGDAAVVGGSLNVDDDASIDGDVGLIGGSLKRAENAHIGGQARDDKGNLKLNVDLDDHDDEKPVSRGSHVLREIGSAITMSAFLFLFGSVFLALGSQRMDALKSEVAARPMKTFALGVVGSIGAVVAFIVLCVTLIGIPVALFGMLVGAVGLYAGITATLTTAGHAVLRHKTKNPYVHLAAGCAMLMVLGALPHIGGLVWGAVIFISIGTLVATRGAGFVPKRTRATPVDPYRTAAL